LLLPLLLLLLLVVVISQQGCSIQLNHPRFRGCSGCNVPSHLRQLQL
jgi:hypothetical protein